MKAALPLLALGTLVLLSVTSFPAQRIPDTSADEARVLSLESAWNQAEQQKDARALDLLLADTLSYVDYDGSLMGKSQFLASAKDSSLKPAQIANESSTVHVY